MTREHDHARNLSTRRGFVVAASLGILGLYGVWTALGATKSKTKTNPDEHGGHGAPQPEAQPEAMNGHGGHGAPVQGPTPDEFRRLVKTHAERWKQADGSVFPGFSPEPAVLDPHAGHGMSATHNMPSMPQGQTTHDMHGAVAEADDGAKVYLMAYQWGFDPAWLKLEMGKSYRFSMMALDVSHGASIQVGKGSLINRMRPGAVVERDITFTERGSHLVYCTVYCGAYHDRTMTARIDVV